MIRLGMAKTKYVFLNRDLSMEQQIVVTNRKAFHDYHILDKYEAGMELLGSEVNSLREGNANLREA